MCRNFGSANRPCRWASFVLLFGRRPCPTLRSLSIQLRFSQASGAQPAMQASHGAHNVALNYRGVLLRPFQSAAHRWGTHVECPPVARIYLRMRRRDSPRESGRGRWTAPLTAAENRYTRVRNRQEKTWENKQGGWQGVGGIAKNGSSGPAPPAAEWRAGPSTAKKSLTEAPEAHYSVGDDF